MKPEDRLTWEFPLRDGMIHLNHAAISPWPRRTRDVITAFADENMRRSAEDFPRWEQEFAHVRQQLARLIHVEADEISLLKNTSEGLSLVAWGLPWKRGENVVSAHEEFFSNRIVWESLERIGVTSRQVQPQAEQSLEDALEAACDEATRLMAISSVQYASGTRVDLARLSRFCRKHGILLLVDAIQSLGALRHDLRDTPIDFLVAGSHKWLMSPEGVGIFYCRPELREQLQLHEYGWGMVAHPGDFERREWRPAPTGRRFECGSPNRLGVTALGASLSLIEEINPEQVEQRVLERVHHLNEGLAGCPGLAPVSSDGQRPDSGILSFRTTALPPARLVDALGEKGIVCATRGGFLRFSPHFYTPFSALDRAARQLRKLLEAS